MSNPEITNNHPLNYQPSRRQALGMILATPEALRQLAIRQSRVGIDLPHLQPEPQPTQENWAIVDQTILETLKNPEFLEELSLAWPQIGYLSQVSNIRSILPQRYGVLTNTLNVPYAVVGNMNCVYRPFEANRHLEEPIEEVLTNEIVTDFLGVTVTEKTHVNIWPVGLRIPNLVVEPAGEFEFTFNDQKFVLPYLQATQVTLSTTQDPLECRGRFRTFAQSLGDIQVDQVGEFIGRTTRELSQGLQEGWQQGESP